MPIAPPVQERAPPGGVTVVQVILPSRFAVRFLLLPHLRFSLCLKQTNNPPLSSPHALFNILFFLANPFFLLGRTSSFCFFIVLLLSLKRIWSDDLSEIPFNSRRSPSLLFFLPSPPQF